MEHLRYSCTFTGHRPNKLWGYDLVDPRESASFLLDCPGMILYNIGERKPETTDSDIDR